jgi:DNA-binding NtrC family response regulator
MGRVLIVDDEAHMRKILAANLEPDQHIVSQAGSVEEARTFIHGHQFDAVLTDHAMPDGNGLDVLTAVHEVDPYLSVIFLSAVASSGPEAETIRKAAYDSLAKPCPPEMLRSAIQRACRHTLMARENFLLKAERARFEESFDLFANETLRAAVSRVALSSSPALITGEPGSGKELAARAVHRESGRSAKPFVSAYCSSVSDDQQASDLFGLERPFLAGASENRAGLLEAAHEGTLFLDEISELSLTVQEKLLRVLNEGQFTRIGSTRSRSIDVRVLAATQHDLAALVREGKFREDLYYRLAALPIVIPPLRERREELATLCDLFLEEIARELRTPKRRLSAPALMRLQSYSFPGNVRELRNLLERAAILCSGEEIGDEHLPLRAKGEQENGESVPGRADVVNFAWIEALPPSFDLRNLLSTLEKTLIERTLQSTRGAQAEAARRLGLSRSDLSYKLLKYELRKETSAAS